MTYTALYRRFRPQLFADLVGQEHISRTLAAAVQKGSFVHAYLFCGPRGTGKTSTAKILARAVNCLEPQQGEPCGVCAACLRSAQGESLDVLEIDAASNRGIDEIRELRERVKYAPALERYKVYIIDEVHMLTAPAFNALLKTLEEPPAHVLFILATTEPHKIPLTVLSRCQRFDFRRIADEAVEAHLRAVAESEGFTAEPEALTLIARKVEGGMRDALGLLDQCAGFGNGQITQQAVMTILGSVDRAFIARVTQLMLAGDLAALLEMVARLHAEGHDLRQFLHDLLEYQRELLLQKLSPGAALPDWAAAAKPQALLKMMQALGDSDGRLRNSLQPRLTLELSLISACGGLTEGNETPARLKKSTVTAPTATEATPQPLAEADVSPQAIAASGKKRSGTATVAPQSEQAEPTPAPEERPPLPEPPPLEDEAAAPAPEPPPAPQTAAENEAPEVETPTQATPKAAAPPSPAATETETASTELLDRISGLWPQIVREVAQVNNSTGAFLAEATPLALHKQKLTLRFSAEYGLFMNNICRPGATRTLVEEKIRQLSGHKLSIEGILAAPEAPPEPEKSEPTAAEHDQESLF